MLDDFAAAYDAEPATLWAEVLHQLRLRLRSIGLSHAGRESSVAPRPRWGIQRGVAAEVHRTWCRTISGGARFWGWSCTARAHEHQFGCSHRQNRPKKAMERTGIEPVTLRLANTVIGLANSLLISNFWSAYFGSGPPRDPQSAAGGVAADSPNLASWQVKEHSRPTIARRKQAGMCSRPTAG